MQVSVVHTVHFNVLNFSSNCCIIVEIFQKSLFGSGLGVSSKTLLLRLNFNIFNGRQFADERF